MFHPKYPIEETRSSSTVDRRRCTRSVCCNMGVVPQPCCCARRSIEDDIFSKACSGCIARIALHLVGILYCAAACCPCTRQSRLLFIVLLSAALAHVNQGSSLCVNSREARINFLSRKKEPASRRVFFFLSHQWHRIVFSLNCLEVAS